MTVSAYRTLSCCICEYLMGFSDFTAARMLLAVVDLQKCFLFYDIHNQFFRKTNINRNRKITKNNTSDTNRNRKIKKNYTTRNRKINKCNTHGYRESSHFCQKQSHTALDEAMLARWNRDNLAKSTHSGSAWRPQFSKVREATNRRSFSHYKNK